MVGHASFDTREFGHVPVPLEADADGDRDICHGVTAELCGGL
jgi:hypothetical protein